jgi:hypothetical protein
MDVIRDNANSGTKFTHGLSFLCVASVSSVVKIDFPTFSLPIS